MASLPSGIFQTHLCISCSRPIINHSPKKTGFLLVCSGVLNFNLDTWGCPDWGRSIATGLVHVSRSFQKSTKESISRKIYLLSLPSLSCLLTTTKKYFVFLFDLLYTLKNYSQHCIVTLMEHIYNDNPTR